MYEFVFAHTVNISEQGFININLYSLRIAKEVLCYGWMVCD